MDAKKRPHPKAGPVVVVLWALGFAVFVFFRTGDPVRALGVVWIAAVVTFAAIEGHEAWRSDRRRWTRVRYTGPERRT